MVIPLSLFSYQSQVKFLPDCRYRNIKSIYFFGGPVGISYRICCRIKKHSIICLRILCGAFKKIQDSFPCKGNMNGHLSIRNSQDTHFFIGFIYMKHTAVCCKSGIVCAIFQCLGRNRCFSSFNSFSFNNIRCMLHIEVFNCFDSSQSFNLAVYAIKESGCCKHTLPGVFFVTGHIVICMISSHNHKRAKYNFLVSGRIYSFDNAFASSLFRFPFYGSDKHIFITEFCHL